MVLRATRLIDRVRDKYKLTEALIVDPLYLKHSHSDKAIDYRVSLSYLPRNENI